MTKRVLAGLAVSVWLASAPVPVGAQAAPLPTPSPIVVPTLPPADPTTAALIRAAAGIITDALARSRSDTANSTRGTVSYFRRFDMQVQTGTNVYRTVHLHPGTVINPRGATPVAGAQVGISGRGSPDGSLDADTITVLR